MSLDITTAIGSEPPAIRVGGSKRLRRRRCLRSAIGVLCSREGRVCLLVALAATMGVTDLIVTLYFMMTTGMCEANPIARFLITGGPIALIAFKLATIAFASWGLFACRRRWSGEVGAWIAVAALTTVLFVWVGYAHAVDGVEFGATTCPDAWIAL